MQTEMVPQTQMQPFSCPSQSQELNLTEIREKLLGEESGQVVIVQRIMVSIQK